MGKGRRRWGDRAPLRVGRRRFLQLAGGSAAVSALALPGCRSQLRVADTGPFTLGVASGDPTPESVILWTRVAWDPLADDSGHDTDAIDVRWELAADESFRSTVAGGTVSADGADAYAVHVDAAGLTPDTWYWYRFHALGFTSMTGRTRTVPAPGTSPERLRFAVAACQDYRDGFYTAYPHLYRDAPDLVFFAGDYIYEAGGGGDVRDHEGPEAGDLEGYRRRYGLYKSDPSLQLGHASCPWVPTWDDHEVDGNYAAHINGQPTAVFLERRAAAYRAWWEHMPVRLPAPDGADLAIYRALDWGDLARIAVLDGRQYRSDQACNDEPGSGCPEIDDPERTMLGGAQEAWLTERLTASSAIWNVVAQNTVFASIAEFITNPDQWDGYTVARQRLLDVVATAPVANFLVLSGDIHAAGAARLHADPHDAGSPLLGHELVSPSISSRSDYPDGLEEYVEGLVNGLAHVDYFRMRNQGYALCELTRDSLSSVFRLVDTVLAPTSGIFSDGHQTIPTR